MNIYICIKKYLMKLVITTGTFGFNALIDEIVYSLDIISKKYNEIVIQYGKSEPDSLKSLDIHNKTSIHLTKTAYYTSFTEFIRGADLVITHAGTGTILSLLTHSVPFIVVPNESLSNNHQKEYTDALASAVIVSDIKRITENILKENRQSHTLNVSSSLWANHFIPLL
ncbi:beta-1,4-N-acetylglucosaminyltransferase [Nematocida parisii]|nr:beta-1,4-N-acetylglucosaminyltransferase [Nematocida parisii]KAI5130968.1 beta-1,4-N-acetylglucosaminyltransferase [Nematocida parisii]KAI5144758.1 beta-1,4-N-acetylglucosaminyltransferase [Nematocida parisii]KAI5156618.1 beta-1,4-N-acetylglucosaminyltransferase [Nematocida parisii]KAI5158900.1 beta-1,4-N-acetylglucosaminyltransferase [Nematocida parisii]